MPEYDYDEALANKYAPEDWGVDPRVPSHLRPQAAAEYLTTRMVPKLWAEIREMQDRSKRGVKRWLAK